MVTDSQPSAAKRAPVQDVKESPLFNYEHFLITCRWHIRMLLVVASSTSSRFFHLPTTTTNFAAAVFDCNRGRSKEKQQVFVYNIESNILFSSQVCTIQFQRRASHIRTAEAAIVTDILNTTSISNCLQCGSKLKTLFLPALDWVLPPGSCCRSLACDAAKFCWNCIKFCQFCLWTSAPMAVLWSQDR